MNEIHTYTTWFTDENMLNQAGHSIRVKISTHTQSILIFENRRSNYFRTQHNSNLCVPVYIQCSCCSSDVLFCKNSYHQCMHTYSILWYTIWLYLFIPVFMNRARVVNLGSQHSAGSKYVVRVQWRAHTFSIVSSYIAWRTYSCIRGWRTGIQCIVCRNIDKLR